MRCSECGVVLPAMPTVYWPADGDEAEEWPLCPSCLEAVEDDEVLIVPGPVYAWGKCLSCGEWMNARELVDVKPGAAGKGDAPGGTCIGCHEVAVTEGGG